MGRRSRGGCTRRSGRMRQWHCRSQSGTWGHPGGGGQAATSGCWLLQIFCAGLCARDAAYVDIFGFDCYLEALGEGAVPRLVGGQPRGQLDLVTQSVLGRLATATATLAVCRVTRVSGVRDGWWLPPLSRPRPPLLAWIRKPTSWARRRQQTGQPCQWNG